MTRQGSDSVILTCILLYFPRCVADIYFLDQLQNDKRSGSAPIATPSVRSTLHCASYCNLEMSCMSFTVNIAKTRDNCRLFQGSVSTDSFNITETGSKHFKRKIECSGACTKNYTLSMRSVSQCELQAETPNDTAWIPKSAFHLTPNKEDVVTSASCNTNSEYRCLKFYMWGNDAGNLTITAGAARSIIFHRSLKTGEQVNFEFLEADIYFENSLPVRFVGITETALGIWEATLWNCPCACVNAL